MMLTEMPIPENLLSTISPFVPPVLRAHNLPQRTLPASAQPFTKEIVHVTPYPESAAQWLINLLELFMDIVNRNKDLSCVVITETEYKQLSGVLDDLIYSVGEDETHPLSATMTLVGVLIKIYEDQNLPKLTTFFPELAENASVEDTWEISDSPSTISGQIDTDFVIVLFSIGCLLWKGGKSDKAISAYDLALHIKPEYAIIHTSRGEAKSSLNDLMGAKVDLQKALKLVEKQGEDNFSTAIKNRLQELDVVEAVKVYFSEQRFEKYNILRDCNIHIGNMNYKVDIVLCDAEGNYITIVECMSLKDSNNEPKSLQSYLCATDAQFGVLASGTDRDLWVFYENLRHNRFQRIERTDFEKRVLK